MSEQASSPTVADRPDLLLQLARSFRRNGRLTCLSGLPAADATGDADATGSDASRWSYDDIASGVYSGVTLLADAGADRGDLVVVAAERGPATVVALLAALFHGAVPALVDGRVTPDRARTQQGDLAPAVTVVDADDRDGWSGRTIAVSAFAPQQSSATQPNDLFRLAASAGGQPVCCLLHTSGSAGVPKQVELTRAGVAARIAAGAPLYHLTDRDVVAHHAAPVFDFALWEWLAPLLSGSEVAVAPPLAEADPDGLARWLRRSAPSVLHFVPSLFAEFTRGLHEDTARAALASVRLLLFGGERLTPSLLGTARGLTPARILNQYGPSEATIDVTAWVDDRARLRADADVPVGAPLPGVICRLLDEHGAVVPDGVVGELHVAGEQVVWGYRGQPGLTAAAFVPVTATDGEPTRMYRTGDLMWQRDGILHFVGRRDDQVKVRGVRVHVHEIEDMATRLPGVVAAAVSVHDGAGAPSLTCHYVAAAEDPGPTAIRGFLRRTLPDAAMPSAFHRHAALPRLASGKVDRSALHRAAVARSHELPAVQAQPGTSAPSGVRPTGPDVADDVGEVAALCATVLPGGRLGPDEDFFAAGGHSLLALRVITRLRRRIGRRVPVRLLYDNPTPRAFTAALAALRDSVPPMRRGSPEGRP